MSSEAGRRPSGSGQTLLGRLEPRIKLISSITVMLMIILIPVDDGYRHAALAVLLLAALFSARAPWRQVAGRLLPLFSMLAGIALISLVFGKDPIGHRFDVLLSLSVKALLSLLCVTVLIVTTGIPSLVQALSALRVPKVMIDITGFGTRYAGVFGKEIRRLRYALISRSGDRLSRFHMVKISSVLVPRLVFKALERSERIYAAMLSRGFTGRMPAGESRRMGTMDMVFALVLALILAGIGVWG